jgi:hypothetical protein
MELELTVSPYVHLALKLPAGETEFWIHINAQIEAHSDLPNNASEADRQHKTIL